MMRRRGFTIVEMLVVIAIIGLLVGMLMPALAAARERARRTKARTMCSQIDTAWKAYLEDSRTFSGVSDGEMVGSMVAFLNGGSPTGRRYMEFSNDEVEYGMLDPWSPAPGEPGARRYHVAFALDGMLEAADVPDEDPVYRVVGVWSYGKDGVEGGGDDITSWD